MSAISELKLVADKKPRNMPVIVVPQAQAGSQTLGADPVGQKPDRWHTVCDPQIS